MSLRNLKLAGLASPITGGAHVETSFDRAQIHPVIGHLCCLFMEDVKPMMARDGQKKQNLLNIAARAFFIGAFEQARFAHGGSVERKYDETIDENSVTGALTLFVGGTMQRGGFYKTVEHYANLWSNK